MIAQTVKIRYSNYISDITKIFIDSAIAHLYNKALSKRGEGRNEV